MSGPLLGSAQGLSIMDIIGWFVSVLRRHSPRAPFSMTDNLVG
jgi:hypothetical protein